MNLSDICHKTKNTGLKTINGSEKAYLQLMEAVLLSGEFRKDRTGVGCNSLFGPQLKFCLLDNVLPLMTTKFVSFNTLLKELLWFMEGSTDNSKLNSYGVSIWDEWADPDGNLGPIYGNQWRSWAGSDGRQHDQLKNLIEGLKKDPFGRRHIVSAWNVGELDKMALPPCHTLFQFYVSSAANEKTNRPFLDCQLYQRSADLFLGVPYNIASYSLLMYIVGMLTRTQPRYFIYSLGDAHVYMSHIEAVEEQIKREPTYFPRIKFGPGFDQMSLDDFKLEQPVIDMFELVDYNPAPKILAPVAI